MAKRYEVFVSYRSSHRLLRIIETNSIFAEQKCVLTQKYSVKYGDKA